MCEHRDRVKHVNYHTLQLSSAREKCHFTNHYDQGVYKDAMLAPLPKPQRL